MKLVKSMKNMLRSLAGSLGRYPVTVGFLIALAILIAIEINSDRNLLTMILACLVGAVSCSVGQAAYERFFVGLTARIALMVPGFVLAAAHYLLIWQLPEYSPEIWIRSAVAAFALFVTFIWVAVIKSRVTFNESFMAAFKAFFESVFFSAVIMGGCSAIIAAIDQLILPVDSTLYSHTANIVFSLFAPIFFLSLIPIYPGKNDKVLELEIVAVQKERISRRTSTPKFLEVLLSYIIIPLASVFSVILLVYILLNIRGEFWTDNLLEPMLISYSITIIMVTILVSRFENKFAVWFRRIFPKVLIPIVLFQLIASLLILRDTGITYGRYYVVLYGVFAICSGVALSIVPVRKNGIIAAMLIAFSVISIVPPVDAFTVSRVSQINILESVLTRNGMLSDDGVTPNDTISDADQAKITSSIQYLSEMEALDSVTWLPQDFNAYEDFNSTFGFDQAYGQNDVNPSVYLFLDTRVPIPIGDYDYFIQTDMETSQDHGESEICTIEREDKTYRLLFEENGEDFDIVMADEDGQDMIRFDAGEIFSRYQSYSTEKSEMSIGEATFSSESERVALTLVVQSVTLDFSSVEKYGYAQLYILVRFK